MLLVIVALFVSTGSAQAVCLDLARKAERLFGVPAPILQAIVLTESGDSPFALNVDGVSYFPASAREATQVIERLKSAASNIDAGCGQISLKYHRGFFGRKPEMALDPWINVVYMSREILDGYKRTGSWSQAVAVYHSGTPERQKVYLCKVARQVLVLSNRRRLSLAGCG